MAWKKPDVTCTFPLGAKANLLAQKKWGMLLYRAKLEKRKVTHVWMINQKGWLTPLKTNMQWKNNHEWRCISYQKWCFSIAMFRYWRVPTTTTLQKIGRSLAGNSSAIWFWELKFYMNLAKWNNDSQPAMIDGNSNPLSFKNCRNHQRLAKWNNISPT